MTAPAITVEHLDKSFGGRAVVCDLSFEVRTGECFGFLGTNGAGKTTTIEILEGFSPRDGGVVRVLGTDPAEGDARWRARIGVVLQDAQLLPSLTVLETVRMFADLYPGARSVTETVEVVGLGALGGARVGGLSGGEKRRLDVALGLVGDPEMLFLDEPTTGFDPAARRDAWSMIDGLKQLGVTILLTTHYMDEAQALADRLLILDAGRTVAEGTYDDLVREHGSDTRVSFVLPVGLDAVGLARSVGVDVGTVDGPRLTFTSRSLQRDLYRLTSWAERERVELVDLDVRRSSLEDVFLHFSQTGTAVVAEPPPAPGQEATS